MSAYSMEEDREKFLKGELDDYIAKSIKASSLINTVKSWLHFEPKSVTSDIFSEVTEEPIINQNTLNQPYKYGGKELIESVLTDFDKEATEQVRNAIKLYKEERI